MHALLRNLRLRTAVGIALLYAAAGCKTASRSPAFTPQPAERSSHPGAVKLSPEDRQTRAKLKPLIQGLNDCIAHYEQWSPIYHSIVGQMEGKDVSRLPHYRVGATDTFSFGDNGQGTVGCADKLERGAALPPAIGDLDTAARTAAADLRGMIGPGLQMDTYTAQKVYLDDHFAKGRELDAAIEPFYANLSVTGHQLRAAIERQNGSIRQHELDLIDTQEGHSLNWHAHNSMIAARVFYNQVRQLNQGNQLTVASVQAAIVPFQGALDAAQSYAAAHPEAARVAPGEDPPLWFSIKDELLRELVDARELRELLADPNSTTFGIPETPQHRRESVSSKADVIREDFNTLIQSYNRAVHFDS